VWWTGDGPLSMHHDKPQSQSTQYRDREIVQWRGRRRIYWCLANAERVRKHFPCCACYTHARCVRARCACVSCACTTRSLSFTRFRSPLPPRRTLASSPLISALHLLSLSSLLLNLVSLVVCVVVQGQIHHRSSLTTLASHLDDGLLRHTT